MNVSPTHINAWQSRMPATQHTFDKGDWSVSGAIAMRATVEQAKRRNIIGDSLAARSQRIVAAAMAKGLIKHGDETASMPIPEPQHGQGEVAQSMRQDDEASASTAPEGLIAAPTTPLKESLAVS